MKKHAGGRPTVMTTETVNKLEYAFSIGCTDREATFYAGISLQTLYDYQTRYPEFVERKEALKETPVFNARATLTKALKENPQYAIEYLKRKKKDEFSERTEHTGKDAKDLIPTPIMPVNEIQPYHSDKENIIDALPHTSSAGGDVSEQNDIGTPIPDSESPVGQDPLADLRSL